MVEVLFYGWMLYASGVLPQVAEVPYLGALWLVCLAAVVIARRRWRVFSNEAVLLICATATSFLLIQLLVHDTPLDNRYMKVVLFWPASAMVIDSLMERDGFTLRLTVTMWIILLLAIPSFEWRGGYGEVDRIRAEGTSIANANDLAAWAAFSALALWIYGDRSESASLRCISRGFSLISLVIVGLAVSRGALIALLVSLLLSLKGARWKEKVAFAGAVALLVAIAGSAPFLGQIVESYVDRATRETGRLTVWPLGVEQIRARPWLGYGLEHARIAVSRDREITVHNAFLSMWHASGVLPLVFFSALWARAFWQTASDGGVPTVGAVKVRPLLVCAFLLIQTADAYYASIWCSMALCMALFRRTGDSGHVVVAGISGHTSARLRLARPGASPARLVLPPPCKDRTT